MQDSSPVENEPFGTQRSRLAEIGRLEAALGRLPYATDLLVYSRDEVTRWGASKQHIVARALREGKVVYARHCGAATALDLRLMELTPLKRSPPAEFPEKQESRTTVTLLAGSLARLS